MVENTIERPKHCPICDLTAGEVETPQPCENLPTYLARVQDGRVFVETCPRRAATGRGTGPVDQSLKPWVSDP